MFFHPKLGSIQYNACSVITRAIRSTSKERLYKELSLKSIKLRRWYRKQYFSKFTKVKDPKYLFKLIREKTYAHAAKNVNNLPFFNIGHNFSNLKNSFFPSTISE